MTKRFEVPGWFLIALMTIALGVAIWAVVKDGPLEAERPRITVTAVSVQFHPTQLTMTLDQEVELRFINDDTVPHSLNIDAFHSGGIELFAHGKQGTDMVFTPDEAGTFDFHCVLHPTAMTGTLTVEG